MLEQSEIPETLEVGQVYTVNVIKQYLQTHKASYIGSSIYDSRASDMCRIEDALKGNLHSYEDGYTHFSKNYQEIYKLSKV
ncbi:hypothetical protein [Salinicoccus halitifaciens]|uniref:Uncharacterized protein n=1 Tax=Salinicoccus halitifaciens TaxID=1073415 RepID=A0ABV2E5P5_9STAP|nr:hypothetical protein [Salinicoccus halitifaciens]MCD2137183.1 hypothetical protein [Salinicoccus halitifaciens]